MPEGFIPPHGGYADLHCFRKAVIIYDGTYIFIERFLQRGDRTRDQMLQAARSGKQNIVEGSKISGTSKEGELKLTGVALGSLEELLRDYGDFLRTRQLRLWQKQDREALYVRRLSRSQELHPENFHAFFTSRPAEVVANIQLCLIHQATYLLERLLKRQERDFLAHGGLRERMFRARSESRRGPSSERGQQRDVPPPPRLTSSPSAAARCTDT